MVCALSVPESLDVLNFDSVSEDDLGPVDRPIEVDEVSSSSDDMISSSPEASEDEEKRDSLHAWGSNKSNYYGGIENAFFVVLE